MSNEGRSKNQGEEKVHGAPLGAEDIKNVKTKFGFNAEEFFHVPADVYQHYKNVVAANDAIIADWNSMFSKYKVSHPVLVFLDFFLIFFRRQN